MIKLTTNPQTTPKIYTFQKKEILIGKGTSSEIDLSLSDLEPNLIQVKIIDQSGCIIAINMTNNPLIKINALPFKKKIIKNDDLLQIEKAEILINIAEEIPKECSYYLADDFDDESENWNSYEDTPKEKTVLASTLTATISNWKLFVSIIFSILSLIFICFSVTYVKLNDKIQAQEIKAAEGVADVAMALTYAQINHISPLTQNWSNPDFLKNNFSAIVPSDYSFLANIDSHGEFNDCPYLLRIYTNNDFSNFLVIALPEASLLQWLIPKNAILVHSHTMQLRKIEDLKSLNRLLVHPNPLDGNNGIEIANLVQNASVIPLSILNQAAKDQGFSPPKALALRRPGAENLIYNALRYYRFSEIYVKRALDLNKSLENSPQELAKLQQEMQRLAKLDNLILYSSEGIHMAMQAEKALATFVPFGRFLNAYVIFNPKGKITGSFLVMEEDQNTPSSTKLDFIQDENLTKHPVLFELNALSSARSHALKGVAKEINDLLNKQIAAYDPEFGTKLADLAIQFQQKDLEEKEKIITMLTKIYDDYSGMPLAQVLPYTKTAGLEHIISEMLISQNNFLHEQNLSEELVGAELQMIKKAKTFDALDESLTKAAELLTLKSIPNAETLIAFQNETVLLVRQKLEEFLLSPHFHLPKTEFREENRKVLSHILETSWITDPNEVSFYLNEFDQGSK